MIAIVRLETTHLPVLTGGLIALTLLAYWVAPLVTLSPSASSVLFWQGALDQNGSILGPRALVAHLLHTDNAHLLWNLLGLTVLGYAIELYSRALLLVATAVGMTAVTLWFHCFSDAQYYVGWSGALNSLFVCALWTFYLPKTERFRYSERTRYTNNTIVILVAVGGLGKTLWELVSNKALITHALWPSAPGAHLAGMFAGTLLCGLILVFRTKPLYR